MTKLQVAFFLSFHSLNTKLLTTRHISLCQHHHPSTPTQPHFLQYNKTPPQCGNLERDISMEKHAGPISIQLAAWH
jgi:hypothetical protein